MKQVIEEAVARVPHFVVIDANAVHRIGDPQEMFKETESNFLVHRISLSEDQRDFQHVLAIKRHPCGPVGLVQMSPGWELRTAVENADIVQAEKAAREHISTVRVLTVHPPVEVQHQALE